MDEARNAAGGVDDGCRKWPRHMDPRSSLMMVFGGGGGLCGRLFFLRVVTPTQLAWSMGAARPYGRRCCASSRLRRLAPAGLALAPSPRRSRCCALRLQASRQSATCVGKRLEPLLGGTFRPMRLEAVRLLACCLLPTTGITTRPGHICVSTIEAWPQCASTSTENGRTASGGRAASCTEWLGAESKPFGGLKRG
ncbi:hypothetical protein J3A72_000473 [Stenotrophomonas sp. PvP093]|nr:hypothetical protein [Stenotrophomonas sp. PvP093]